MHNRPQHKRRAHCRKTEPGLLLLDKVPGGALGEGLGGAVAVCGVLDCLGGGDGVPVRFAVDVAWAVALEAVDDGGEGGGDDDAGDGGGGFLDGGEDAGCADYGWVEEFLGTVLVGWLWLALGKRLNAPSAHQ